MAELMHVQTIAAVVLLSLSAFLIGGNYLGIAWARRTNAGFSCIPILGGLLGCAGFLLLPKIRLLAFIPPLVDPGCVLLVVALLVRILKKDLDGSR